MAIHLVRHARAGSRPDWHQPDDLRPLTGGGLVQATVVAAALQDFDVRRITSSRYVRCVQTVQPLADHFGIGVAIDRALAEEAAPAQTWALVEETARLDGDSVLCSHGNVIASVLERLHRRAVELVGEDSSCRKGSVWTVEVTDGVPSRVVQTVARS